MTFYRLRYIMLPCVSMMIFTIGNSLLTSVSSLDLMQMHLDALLIGIITSAYFLGGIVAAFYAPPLIARIGYIRAVATFSSVAGSFILLQALLTNPIVWFIARGVVGYTLTGLSIVVQNWLLHNAQNNEKGRLLSIYLSLYYLAQASGQLLLGVNETSIPYSFCFIALFVILSIIPVATTKLSAPESFHYQKISFWKTFSQAQVGIILALLIGIVLGSIYAIYPLFLHTLHFNKTTIGNIMFATILGAAILQYPLGKLTDIFDRRKVLIIVTSILVAVMTTAISLGYSGALFYVVFSLILGGLSFVIYPVSIALTTDRLEKNQVASGLSCIAIAYGVGSVLGPILSGFAEKATHQGFFIFLDAVFCLTLLYLMARIFKRYSENLLHGKGQFKLTAPIVTFAKRSFSKNQP